MMVRGMRRSAAASLRCSGWVSERQGWGLSEDRPSYVDDAAAVGIGPEPEPKLDAIHRADLVQDELWEVVGRRIAVAGNDGVEEGELGDARGVRSATPLITTPP
jgi:hypothetical protein